MALERIRDMERRNNVSPEMEEVNLARRRRRQRERREHMTPEQREAYLEENRRKYSGMTLEKRRIFLRTMREQCAVVVVDKILQLFNWLINENRTLSE